MNKKKIKPSGAKAMNMPATDELVTAVFTGRDIEVIQANIQELSQSGRLGNADSLAMRIEAAIQRAEEQAKETAAPEAEKHG